MSPTPTYPGVYVEEAPSGLRTIQGVETSICVFVGRTPRGPLPAKDPLRIRSHDEFRRSFGDWHPALPVMTAVQDFFRNGGKQAVIVRVQAPGERLASGQAGAAEDGGPPLTDADYLGDAGLGTGLQPCAASRCSIWCAFRPIRRKAIPRRRLYQAALAACVARRAMLLVDPPAAWNGADAVARDHGAAVAALGLTGDAARNAILYFPRLLQRAGDSPQPSACVPCGAVAGVIARTDHDRGVWKAPAGMEADLRDVSDLAIKLTDAENGLLNPLGINALRSFPGSGKVIWGARTLRGADALSDEYKYVPVRRLALYIEESVSRGIGWAAFEPNGEPLWAQLRLNVDAFLHGLFRQGALQGTTPREAYFVQCDARTNTREDIDRGLCWAVIGFAPLKPAEFVVLRIAQKTVSPTG